MALSEPPLGPPRSRSAPQRAAQNAAKPLQTTATTAGAPGKEAPNSLPNHTV